jgi:hypothetical protein
LAEIKSFPGGDSSFGIPLGQVGVPQGAMADESGAGAVHDDHLAGRDLQVFWQLQEVFQPSRK